MMTQLAKERIEQKKLQNRKKKKQTRATQSVAYPSGVKHTKKII
jgi:hypothetical protein